MHAQTDTDAAREFADIVGDPFEHLQRILTPDGKVLLPFARRTTVWTTLERRLTPVRRDPNPTPGRSRNPRNSRSPRVSVRVGGANPWR